MHYFALILVVLFMASPAKAHEITPSIVTVTLGENQQGGVEIKTNLEAVLADIGSGHQDTDESPRAAEYNRLRELPPTELKQAFQTQASELAELIDLRINGRRIDLSVIGAEIPEVGNPRLARSSTLNYAFTLPFDAAELRWQSSPRLANVVLKVENEDGQKAGSQWLKDGAASQAVSIGALLKPASTLDVFKAYLVLGFTHIVPGGLDHVLFVLGLFLLSIKWRPLLYQVTAFTVAHTITLGLAINGLITLSPAIVEPLIALSIAYVAIENIFAPTLKAWRVALVFAFGLLHGMGFAGVLEELGLPEGEFLTALISFNIGVELGQMAVILGALLALGVWFKDKEWYRSLVVIPGSAAIALTGLWWTIERTFF